MLFLSHLLTFFLNISLTSHIIIMSEKNAIEVIMFCNYQSN